MSKQPVIKINSKRDWETYYDPKLVGEYLNQFDYGIDPMYHDLLIDWKPGMWFPPLPSPNLQDFLKWVAKRSKGAK